MPIQNSSNEEIILCPNSSTFTNFDWLSTYEISRVLHTVIEPEELKLLQVETLIEPGWKQSNPNDIRDKMIESLKLNDQILINKDIRILNQVKSIPTNLKVAINKALIEDHKEKYEDLLKQIEFSLELNHSINHDKKLRFKILTPKFCKSNALYRKYGSNRFLIIKLDSNQFINHLRSTSSKFMITKELTRDFFTRPLRIANRAEVIMVDLQSTPESSICPSFSKFMNDTLNIELNQNLSLAKWVARSSLLLSSTNPTIDFKPENIRRVPDVFSNSLLISHDEMNLIADALGLNYLPSAIEGRIQAKEVFVWRLGKIPESDDDENHLIQLWEDQVKGFKSVVFIKFMAFCYNFKLKGFQKEELFTSIALDQCQIVKGLTGKGSVMTDGAAAISHLGALQISRANGKTPDFLPSVYQGRIGFAKGLWFLDPNSDQLGQTCWIEIRDSQWKANLKPDSQFHFNLCRYSVPVEKSASLGKQNLPILASRGVPSSTLRDLIHEAVQAIKEDFLTSDPLDLAKTMARQTSLLAQRKITLRNQFRSFHDPTINRVDKTMNNSIKESTTDQLDPLSLAPMSFEEELTCLLTAGFSTSNRQVVEGLRKVKEAKLTRMLNFKIPVTQSAYVYVIPDPTGTLREDEAFLQFSSFRNPYTGLRVAHLICSALISRAPCVAPIDVQRINLVANASLKRAYFDILVCSIHGDRALLSLLSGGDYDGDQVFVIWDQRLVEPFQNAYPSAYHEPNETEWFDKVLTRTVKDQLLLPYKTDSKMFMNEAQKILLKGLFTPSHHSVYSLRHSLCDYILGSEDPLTFLIGWIYVKCLDAPKSGLVLRPQKDGEIIDLLKRHIRRLKIGDRMDMNLPMPSFLKDEYQGSNRYFKYPHESIYVLDRLRDTILKARDEFRSQNQKEGNNNFYIKDPDLYDFFLSQKSMFDKPLKKIEDGQKEDVFFKWGRLGIWIGVLRRIQRKISSLNQIYCKAVERSQNDRSNHQLIQDKDGYVPREDNTVYFVWESAYDEDKDELEDLLNANDNEKKIFKLSKRAYLDGLRADGYALLKASCASYLTSPTAYFPYVMAFREICYLKGQAMAGKYWKHFIPLQFLEEEKEFEENRSTSLTQESNSSLASVVKCIIKISDEHNSNSLV
ncbi:hypothetical protein CROQUDRAFT_85752 [Cronartium quercuum f. sp. fusiforme G11]|uniref:RNA-dependent RNA polymerase n=1 Tax=Cronartium quercuum f. sp. fusiforme G11 TaxID=708437 RepID=A0A9P6THZ3_9BASI|nr:hypothetical protein CROQUDRAFT_85752 [Cronartium quercuum f. sp. fusiforme G11]